MSSGKWMYLVLDLNERPTPMDMENQLDIYGDGGWELVAVDKGIAYLKRPSCYEEEEG